MKHVFQPFDIKFSEDGKKVTVKNLNYFRGGEGYSLRMANHALQSAKKDIPLGLSPRGEATFDVPVDLIASGFTVVCSVVLMENDGILKAGHVVASASFANRRIDKVRNLKFVGDVESSSDGESLRFGGKGFSCRFDRRSGALVSYVRDGMEFLLAPMTVDAFRAPSSNEVGLGGRWALAGLRDLVQTATSISDVTKNADGSKSFTVVADVRGRQKERLVGFGGRNGAKCEIVPAGPVSPQDPRFIVAQKWTVFANGALACQSEIRSRGRVVELARIGYRLTLDRSFDNFGWLGLGPHENYPDRKSGAAFGWWSKSVADMVEGYAKPQDMGNREGVVLCVCGFDKGGVVDGIAIAPLGSGEMSVSAIPYSPTELALAMHPQELPEAAKTELGFYAAVRGLGGASCGPGPMGRDIVRNNKTFVFDFVIMPILRGGDNFEGFNAKEELPTLPPAELPPDVRTDDDILPVVIACSSAEPGEGDAEHLVDGDLSTIWHSQYGVTLTKYPHAVTVDLNRTVAARGVSIWQRQSGSNGMVKDFRFEVSEDGKAWKGVLVARLKANSGEQKFAFAAPEKVRYWRFTGLNEQNGREFASLAEICIDEAK